MARALAGKTILIVEDEYLVGEDLRRILANAGAEAIGPIDNPTIACAIVRKRWIDGAVLDVRLREETSIQVATLLNHQHVPFIVVSGYQPDEIPGPFREAPFVAKPVLMAPLASLASAVFSRARSSRPPLR